MTSELEYFIERLDACADESELSFVASQIRESEILTDEQRHQLRVVYKECLIAIIVFDDRTSIHDKVRRLEVMRGKGSDEGREKNVSGVHG